MKDLLTKHDQLVKLELQEAMKFAYQVSSADLTGTSHFLRDNQSQYSARAAKWGCGHAKVGMVVQKFACALHAWSSAPPTSKTSSTLLVSQQIHKYLGWLKRHDSAHCMQGCMQHHCMYAVADDLNKFQLEPSSLAFILSRFDCFQYASVSSHDIWGFFNSSKIPFCVHNRV